VSDDKISILNVRQETMNEYIRWIHKIVDMSPAAFERFEQAIIQTVDDPHGFLENINSERKRED